MALSDANVVKIAQVLNKEVWLVEGQIDTLGDRLTSAVQTAIEAQLTLWDTAATNFTAIRPKERNFGAEINPGEARNSIRQQIAILLERPDWGMTGSRLVRC